MLETRFLKCPDSIIIIIIILLARTQINVLVRQLPEIVQCATIISGSAMIALLESINVLF